MDPALSESNARNFSTLSAAIESGKVISELDMPLTVVIFAIVAVGVVPGLVNRLIPIMGRSNQSGQIKSILDRLVGIVLVLWIGNLYGLVDRLRQFHVGH